MSKLGQLLTELTEVAVGNGRWKKTQERLNSMQEAIKALARGDNIVSGKYITKNLLNPHTISLSGTPGGGGGGSSDYPLKIKTAIDPDNGDVLVDVVPSFLYDYTVGSTAPAKFDITPAEPIALSAAGNYTAFVRVSIDQAVGKKVTAIEWAVEEGEIASEEGEIAPEDGEVLLEVGTVEVIKTGSVLSVGVVENLTAGFLSWPPRPPWLGFDEAENDVTFGQDYNSDEAPTTADPTVITDLTIWTEEDLNINGYGGEFQRGGATEGQPAFQIGTKLGTEETAGAYWSTAGGYIGVGSLAGGAEDDSGYLLAANTALSEYVDIRPATVKGVDTAAGEFLLDAGEVPSGESIQVKLITMPNGDEIRTFATDDIDLSALSGAGVPWADYDAGNLKIGGASTDGVADLTIGFTGQLSLVGGADFAFVVDPIRAELSYLRMGSAHVNVQDLASFFAGDITSEVGTAISPNSIIIDDQDAKSITAALVDLPASGVAKFRSTMVCDGDDLKESYIMMTEPKTPSP